MPLAVPRARDGNFEPELVKKVQTRIDGMADKIVGLYAAGLSVCDIRAHLAEVYGLKVSPDLPIVTAGSDDRAVDQPRHGYCSGQGTRMAKPRAGPDVPDRDL